MFFMGRKSNKNNPFLPFLALILFFVALGLVKSYRDGQIASVEGGEAAGQKQVEVPADPRLAYDCGSKYLKPLIVNDELFCSLDVPYINQSLNSAGMFTQDPSGKGDVDHMCTAAASVMVGAYYDKLKYENLDQLREHIYKSQTSTDLVAGNTVTVDGYKIKLCIDGAFGITSFDVVEKKSKCNWNNNYYLYLDYLGIKAREMGESYANAVAELKMGRPVFSQIKPYDELAGGVYQGHFIVIKGFSTVEGSQRLLLNDPYRDLNVKSEEGKCGGLTILANRNGYNSVFDYNNHPCSKIGYFWSAEVKK